MDISTIVSFAFVAALLVISPGPNGVLIARTVPTSGKAAGFANVFGMASAMYVHGALVVFGVSIILVRSAELFALVKYAGAAYLCWIGVKALYDAWRGDVVHLDVKPARRRRTLARAYGEGLLTNTLNPKVAMFYLAAFPQFVPFEQMTAANTFLLVFIHSTLNLMWFSAMVAVFARVMEFAKGGSVTRWIKGVTGVVFLGLGAKLAALRP
jgi:threonine/homoserine/homoserine lactone efflux protein